jgi:hypothetical protein
MTDSTQSYVVRAHRAPSGVISYTVAPSDVFGRRAAAFWEFRTVQAAVDHARRINHRMAHRTVSAMMAKDAQ